jgi:Tol biopolymer transport system component
MNLQDQSRQRTLESWKEIAAYLQRDAKTAQRWEKEEGLPIHRHSHKSRSSVYAYTGEIDTWRASRKAAAEPVPPKPLWRFPAFALTGLLCLVMAGSGIRPQVASAQQGKPLAKRLLCPDCGNWEAGFSQDGRWMVFTDSVTGDLAIRNMFTGKVKRLLAKTGADTWIKRPLFSPDLRQIAYGTGEKESHLQLRLTSNEPGGKARALIDGPDNNYYQPAAWFPDGKSILATLWKSDRTTQIVRASVSDGAVKVLKSLEWRMWNAEGSRPNLSPDGQYIVYSVLAVNPTSAYPAHTDPSDQHIYILAADGSSETEVVKTSGINKNPIWTPDGKHILFTSDRSGKDDLWSIAVLNGRAAGAASLVSPEIGDVRALGMHSGSYYYTKTQAGVEYVNIAGFAPSGNSQSRILQATESFVGIRATWSPDGKSIAFKRRHPGSEGDFDLVVHSLETGDERTYLTDLGTSGVGAPVWFHDGKTIMTGFGRDGAARLPYRIDLKTGEFKALPSPLTCVLSPDDKTNYCVRSDPKNPSLPQQIVAVDLTSGQERLVFTQPEPGFALFVVTPDSRAFVIWRQDVKAQTVRFARVNVDGTGYREIYNIAKKDFQDNLTLTKDGLWILLAKRHDDNWQLVRIPIEGGEPELTGLELEATLVSGISIQLSPDGSRIAFTTKKRAEELWALDNVLSALK